MADEILDVDEFMERVQDDKELLLELLDIFVSDYLEKAKLIREAVSSDDFEQIKSIAHSLKGASGNISAKKLRESFVKLEELGKNSDTSGADELLSTMNQQFEELSVRIESVKEELK